MKTSPLPLILILAPRLAASSLAYSGADLRVGPGTLTITCTSGGSPLWALEVTRQTTGKQVLFSRFDDLTGAGAFDYASPGGYGNGLFVAHGTLDAGSFAFTPYAVHLYQMVE